MTTIIVDKPDHPLVGVECPACGALFAPGDEVVEVARGRLRAHRRCGAAPGVHAIPRGAPGDADVAAAHESLRAAGVEVIADVSLGAIRSIALGEDAHTGAEVRLARGLLLCAVAALAPRGGGRG